MDATAVETTMAAPLAPAPAPGGPHRFHLDTGDAALNRILKGGLPHRSFTLQTGPAFLGKEDFTRSLLVHRLLAGSPALVILTDASVPEWRRALEGIDPRVAPRLEAGQVEFIDVYSHEVGVSEPAGAHATVVPAPIDLHALRPLLDEACRRLAPRGPHPLMVIDTLSTLFHYSDPSALFRMLRSLVGCARSHGYTGLVHLEDGEHSQQEIHLVRRICQGVLSLRRSRDATELSIEGLGLPGPPRWYEYEHTPRSFRVTGAALRRIV